MDFEINKNVTEEMLRNFGFTDHSKDTWYYSKNIGSNITFNIFIPKNKINKFKIEILDEDFLQPYIYQLIDSEFSRQVKKKRKEIISNLINSNILIKK